MLPETGSISMSQVNVELKKSETAVITLNDTDVRKLAGKPSGVISMNDLRGKKASEHVENYQIYSNEWSGVSKKGSFTISFPKKVISGKIIAVGRGSSGITQGGKITILGTDISSRGTKEMNIPVGTISLTGNYSTGYNQSSNGSFGEGRIGVTVKFTGEWEA